LKRRSGTLYELGRERLSRKSTSPPRRPMPEPERPPSGTSARLPVGLLAVAAAGVLIVVLLIWWIGCSTSSTGDTAATEATTTSDATGSGQPPGHVIDPLVTPPRPEPTPGAGPAEQEPRQDGKWYFVLAETRPEGARRLAVYCREQGLDAVVISGHNTRLERVIALPGLDSASTTTDAYRSLDVRIRDVGRRWKASGGTTNLSDRYLHRKQTQPKKPTS